MDTVERASLLADNLDGYTPKDSASSLKGNPQLPSVSPSPYGGHALPSTMTQAPDSQRQFYRQGGAGQQRFFNTIPVAANQSAASSQSQAQQFAKWQSTALTLDAIADSPTYAKVPIEQFDSNGNLIVVNFQGPWDSSTTYSDGQEVSYGGNVWVATTTNTNSTPAAANPFWQLVGPQTLDNVADGTSYAKVSIDAVGPGGSIDFSGTAWLNKTLDHLPDGSTYSRVLGNALTSGQVDLAQTGVVNKTLDHISDTTTYSRVLSNLTFSNTLRSPHASSVAQINPTHWWPFEGISGGAPVQDIGTSPINLTFSNVSGGGSEGISGFSLVNGDSLLAGFLSNFAAFITEPSGSYSGNFTIGAWCYFNGVIPTSTAPIKSMQTNTLSTSEDGLWIDTLGRVNYSGVFTTGVVTLQSASLNWAVPHHICYSVSGPTVTLYVDGQDVASGTAPSSGSHGGFNTVTWGASYNAGTGVWTYFFSTTLQHMTIWRNVVLTSGQIAALYQAGATGAQSLDNLVDGRTWQRVKGVSGNKTNSSSYNTGSISSNYTASTGAGSITFAPGTPTNIVSLTLSASAQNAVLISGLYQCFWSSAIGGGTVALNLVVNGTVIASYVMNTVTHAGGETVQFTIAADHWAGSLDGATVALQAETTNTTLAAFTGAGSNCYLTVGNFKA